jgi:hypothetical protein
MYRVSHNTWDYKKVFGRPLHDNVEKLGSIILFKCGVSGSDFFVINFSKKPTTENVDDFI